MKDVIVVGAGIIGTTVAKALREQQHLDVLLLDDNRPMGGSRASEGHLKPSWFGMKPAQYEPAMQVLSDTWSMIEEQYEVRPDGAETTVYRVNMDVVTKYPYTPGRVTNIGHLNNYPTVTYFADGIKYAERCRLLVVAAGCWVPELLPQYKVKGKRGVSFRFKHTIQRGYIEAWAPYKQLVAHQQGPLDVWIGDGTAILAKNWTPERTQECLRRCSESLGVRAGTTVRAFHGIRPYAPPLADGEPCLFERLGPRAWVATGAGKSGTIAAGWVTRRLLDAFST